MISNRDMPAMPVVDEDGALDCKRYEEYAMSPLTATGLTKREMFAMHFMNGILSNQSYTYNGFSGAAKMASEASDALLAELERTK